MTLKGRNEKGNERFEPFAADPVGGLPQHDQRRTHRLVV